MSCVWVEETDESRGFWCKRDTIQGREMNKALQEATKRAEAAGLATASCVDEDEDDKDDASQS